MGYKVYQGSVQEGGKFISMGLFCRITGWEKGRVWYEIKKGIFPYKFKVIDKGRRKWYLIDVETLPFDLRAKIRAWLTENVWVEEARKEPQLIIADVMRELREIKSIVSRLSGKTDIPDDFEEFCSRFVMIHRLMKQYVWKQKRSMNEVSDMMKNLRGRYSQVSLRKSIQTGLLIPILLGIEEMRREIRIKTGIRIDMAGMIEICLLYFILKYQEKNSRLSPTFREFLFQVKDFYRL